MAQFTHSVDIVAERAFIGIILSGSLGYSTQDSLLFFLCSLLL